MKDNVLNIIKKKSISFDLLISISNLDNDELKEILDDLLNEKRIFINSYGKYEFKSDGLLVGTLERNSKGVSFIVSNGQKIIIEPDDLHTALKYDTVVVEVSHENRGIVKGIIERKNNMLVCEVRAYHNKLVLIPFNGNCELHLITDPELLKDFIVGDRVYTILPDTISDDNVVVVDNVTKISHSSERFSDEKAIAISKGFEVDFSEEELAEAEALPKYVREVDKIGRVDLTDKVIYTIDSLRTKDIDDAISVERLDNGNILLGVHIADVGYYIKPGTLLFKAAKRRKTSVYIGDLVIPMIPSSVSNGICSINPGVERLARSTFIEYSPNGKVVNYSTCKSVIKSRKKMTYEELNEYFHTNEIDASYLPFVNQINDMKDLSSVLAKIKLDNGYLEFESSDTEVQVDPYKNDEIIGFVNRVITIADKIIEFFMVECNVVRAKDFNIRSIPIFYRIHDKPDALKLESTFDLIKELGYGKQLVKLQNAYGPKAIQNILHYYNSSPLFSVISNLLLRSMARAEDSVDNIGHFALGEEYYGHFTAPIRRFIDLMHQVIEDLFSGECIGYHYIDEIRKALYEIAEDYNYKERQANDAEIDFAKLRMAQFMDKHKDEEFVGMILDIDKDKVFVKLDNNVKGVLDLDSDFGDAFSVDTYKRELVCNHSKQKIKLGSKLLLKVSRVDIPQKEVYFSVKEILKDNTYTQNNNVKKRVRTLK